MFRKSLVLVLIAGLLLFTGCTTHVHQVGDGPTGKGSAEARQWYILFGLVPLNDVDSQELAAGADDYEIVTESSFLDLVMGIFTGLITVHSRTVTVTQ